MRKTHAAQRRPVMLPSLNALWTFEAAARNLSFTRAASELSVTQTAVSHQIRRLEAELGYPLFRRIGQRVSLTREGEAWAQALAPVFNKLRDVCEHLMTPGGDRRDLISVSVVPSFGSRWLMPRLGAYMREYPDSDLRISATDRVVDLTLEPVDVAIRYGRGKYPGFAVTKLAEDAFIVVAAPSLLERTELANPQQLAHLQLFHDDHPHGWADWFKLAKAQLPDSAKLTELSESTMLVEAALRGQGPALARLSLVLDDLALGRLVQLFPEVPPLRSELAYYVVSAKETLKRPAVAAFKAWLLREAQHLESWHPTASARS